MIYIGGLVLGVLLIASQIFINDKPQVSPLGKIHQDIVIDYPNMSHISRADLEKELSSSDLVILDTRPEKEYNVSHIEGALQVDPDITPDSFRVRYGQALKNKKIIVYCSVGKRSSILGNRMQSIALEAGAMSVQNLEGGLFGWHNDSRPLVNASGETASIHPYNAYWGRLIENRDEIRYRP